MADKNQSTFTTNTPDPTGTHRVLGSDSNGGDSYNFRLDDLCTAFLSQRDEIVVAASNSRKKQFAHIVCDGTNDQNDIMQAVADVGTGGGRVRLMRGDFWCGAPIVVDISGSNRGDNIVIEGAGCGDRRAAGGTQDDHVTGTRLLPASGFSGSHVLKIKNTSAGRPVHNVQLRHFLVDGNGKHGSNIHGIYYGVYRGHVFNVRCMEMSGDGMQIEGVADSGGGSNWQTYDGEIIAYQGAYNAGHGLKIMDEAPDLHLMTILCYTNGGSGIQINSGSEQFTSVHTYSNGEYGIHFNNAGSRTKLTNCKIENNDKHGLYIEGSTQAILDGANFKGNSSENSGTYDDVHLSNAYHCSLFNLNFGHIGNHPKARRGVHLNSGSWGNRIEIGGRTDDSDHTDKLVHDGGGRNIINGVGTNSGNPQNAGNWNNNERDGVLVWDTSNSQLYVAVNGAWHAV